MPDTSWTGARQPSRSLLGNRPLVVLGILAVLLLGGIAAGVVFAASQANQPELVLTRYCTDLTQQKYTDAYTLLSSGARSQANRDQWAQDAQAHDQIDGVVKSCTVSHANGGPLTFASAGTSATLTIVRNKAATGSVALAHEVDGWKLNQLAAPLQGTDLSPLRISEQFCAALAKQDFAGAYAQLSQREHAGTTQADFTKAYTTALSGASAKVTGCTPKLATYAVQGSSAGVDVQMQLQVSTSAGTSTVPVPLHFTLVPESSGWKIDAIKASGA